MLLFSVGLSEYKQSLEFRVTVLLYGMQQQASIVAAQLQQMVLLAWGHGWGWQKKKKKKGSFWGQNRFGWASRDLVLLRGEKYFLRARRTSLGACSLAETAPDVMNRIHRERANSFWDQRKPTSKQQIFGAQALWECTLQLGSRSPFSSSPVSLVFQQRQVLFPEEDQVLLQWETRQ